MNKLKKQNRKNMHIYKKDRRIYESIAIAFVMICISMGFLCFQYYRHLQDTVKTESSGYIQEIAKQMGTNVNKIVSDNFSVLETVATVLESSKVNSYEQVQEIIQEQQNIWKYEKMMLIDEKGITYDEKGEAIKLSSDTYLQEVIVEQKASMSSSQVIDGRECIVFAIPFEGVQIGNTKMVAIAASYDLSTFDKILSMTAFEGNGYAHIIHKDGTVVIRSSSKNALETGYNILNFLSDAKLSDGKHIDEVRSSIANGESGHLEFTLGSANEYMTYTPLEKEEWSLLTFIPVSVISEKSNTLLKITLLLCGFVTIAFSLLFISLILNFYRNKSKLEAIAYVDTVTNGNTIQKFYELVEEMLLATNKPQYALIYTNIEKFKVLNEQYGKRACDEILCSIESGISADLRSDECMGRLFADNFCVLVKYEDEVRLKERFGEWQKGFKAYIQKNGAVELPLIIEFGVFVIGNESIPLAHMVDRAKLSLSEIMCELPGKLRYAIYDDKIHRMLLREKQLEDIMEEALENKEFEVYLQPKYHTQTEKIGGAEALVRWIRPSEGMIYPDEFIPLFEKNGFIIQVDLFVFEKVCSTIRKWIDAGEEPIKVSVNCSRVQLKNPNFLRKYSQIAKKYDIPKKSIEIELTENTVFEDVGRLSEIIREIHTAGFGCSMDDFGSGYSSLNLIQDIPVDTLKLDKIFFRSSSRELSRTESVVGSIISMSKALSMETVAEGVEERVQLDMLKRLRCDYIQGYYFAKPMPIADFESLAFSKVIENTVNRSEGEV